MKKTLSSVIVGLFIVAPFAVSAGFVGASDQHITTVAAAKEMRDDSAVALKGNIEKHLRKDKYQFADATGKITVEIDREDWRGVEVGPTDTVIIYGEVDRDWVRGTEIDVDAVKIVK